MRVFEVQQPVLLSGSMRQPGELLSEREVAHPGALENMRIIKEVIVPDHYDPKELARLAADVDRNVQQVDAVPNPRDHTFEPPVGVPNPNLDLYTPASDFAAAPYRELAGEDVTGDGEAQDGEAQEAESSAAPAEDPATEPAPAPVVNELSAPAEADEQPAKRGNKRS